RRAGFYLFLGRAAGLPALHAAGGVSRHAGAGGAGFGQSPANTRLAPPPRAGKDFAPPSGVAGRGGVKRGRQRFGGAPETMSRACRIERPEETPCRMQSFLRNSTLNCSAQIFRPLSPAIPCGCT